MVEARLSSSGEDPFLEVKAISRVLSSEATRGPDSDHLWPQESFKNETMAGQIFRTLSIPRMDQTKTNGRHRSVQHNDSKKHLMSESPGGRPKSVTYVCPLQGSDSKKHLITETPGGRSKSVTCGCPVQWSVLGSAKSTKSPRKPKGEGVGFSCSCQRENERWQQGQWSGEEWDTKRFTTKKAGMCKCVAGAAGDCTAVCCCPLSLLHLLALACIKLPTIIAIRTLRKVKSKLRKKQKCQEADDEDNVGPTTPFTPSLSCREAMSEVSWAPSSGFGDSRMWQEYFGADGVGLADH